MLCRRRKDVNAGRAAAALQRAQDVRAETGLGEDGVGAISTGRESSIVLLSSGEVLTWGRNQRGELGGGRLDESLLPVQVPGVFDVTLARAGRSPSAAIKQQTGSWMAWGFSGGSITDVIMLRQ